jgi:arylsulfatase A-like enzyme
MVTAMDGAIGNITKGLKTAVIFNDTVIIFTADKISQKVYFLTFILIF